MAVRSVPSSQWASAIFFLELFAFGDTIMLDRVFGLGQIIAPSQRIYSGILLGGPMFESLSERIEKDEQGTVNPKQRMLFWIAVFVVVFAGCFFGIKLFGS
jgi:hypothetical protein